MAAALCCRSQLTVMRSAGGRDPRSQSSPWFRLLKCFEQGFPFLLRKRAAIVHLFLLPSGIFN